MLLFPVICHSQNLIIIYVAMSLSSISPIWWTLWEQRQHLPSSWSYPQHTAGYRRPLVTLCWMNYRTWDGWGLRNHLDSTSMPFYSWAQQQIFEHVMTQLGLALLAPKFPGHQAKALSAGSSCLSNSHCA